MKYVIPGLSALVSLVFLFAGVAKLIGVDAMIALYDTIGVGHWFRYVTGIVEITGAVLLWIKGRQAIGAALLSATMAGAVVAHLTVLGPSIFPALILGLLAAGLLWHHRAQLTAA
jgi:putative oxidoreductase